MAQCEQIILDILSVILVSFVVLLFTLLSVNFVKLKKWIQ
jgi:hypothetical protein